MAEHGAPLASFHRLQPAAPDIGLPVLSQHWSVALPPGYAMLGGSDGCTSLTVIYRPTIDAAGWLLFLAVVGLGAWRRPSRPLALLVVTTVCGACGLLLPAILATVFFHGLGGVAFCLVLLIVRRATRTAGDRQAAGHPRSGSAPAKPPRELPSTLTNIIPYGAPVLAAVMLCNPGGAPAVEGGHPDGDVAPTYSVFIPVNDKQQPTGGKYFVPEAFYAELYRRAAAGRRGGSAVKAQNWTIESAVYRAELAEDAALQEHVVERLTVEYGIHVFHAAAGHPRSGSVRIPLRREEVSLVPGLATLDDKPVQPDWEADGSALLLDIADPGDYRLELALRPNIPQDRRGSGLDLAVPRVPTARLEVTTPAGGPPITVPSALGAVRHEEMPLRWIAELGPSDRLILRWQDPAADSTGPIIDQQLQWLKIEPGCVLLDVRLNAKAAAGLLRRLQVKTDASLELLDDPKTAVHRISTPGNDATQTLELDPPQAAAEAMFDLHFLCAGASPIGTFRAPKIEVVGAQTARRWLAVSLDPTLDYQLPGARLPVPGVEPLLGYPRPARGYTGSGYPAEFVSSWGAVAAAPNLAFRLNGDAADWSMTTRLRRAETTGDQTVSWSFDADCAHVLLDAQLTATDGNMFQYALTVPAELSVDALTVSGEGTSVPVHWTAGYPRAGGDGRLTVFLGSGVTGRHRLQLRGQMPLAMNRKIALPTLRLEDVRTQNCVVRLYSRPAVQVDVSAAQGLTEVKSPVADPGYPRSGSAADLGQPLRSFYADPTGRSLPEVTVRANRVPVPKESAASGRRKVPASSLGARPPRAPGGAARIAAADIRFAWDRDGRRTGVAVFDIEAPGAAEYPLTVPEGFDLLHLAVDGVPLDAPRSRAGTWTVPLTPHAGKSRVEMLFVASPTKSSASTGRMDFPGPRLGDLRVEHATWTIAPPRGVQAVSAEAEGGSIAPAAAVSEDPGDLAAGWRQVAVNGGDLVAFSVSGPCDSISVTCRAIDAQSWLPRLVSVAGFLAAMVLVINVLRRGYWRVDSPVGSNADKHNPPA